MRKLLRRLMGDECAQNLVEYALLLAFLGLVVVAFALSAGSGTSGIWGAANTTLAQAAPGSDSGSPGSSPPADHGDHHGDHHDGR